MPRNPGDVLKHKVECRTIGVQTEKEQFPEGKNTTESANQGFIYFDSIYAYNEKLNTCLMLSGFELTNLKTRKQTSYQATLTNLLSNNVLGTYLVLGGRLAPVSMNRDAFLSRARDLFGEPLPRWLEQTPAPQ